MSQYIKPSFQSRDTNSQMVDEIGVEQNRYFRQKCTSIFNNQDDKLFYVLYYCVDLPNTGIWEFAWMYLSENDIYTKDCVLL
jgi:hypothetical protein